MQRCLDLYPARLCRNSCCQTQTRDPCGFKKQLIVLFCVRLVITAHISTLVTAESVSEGQRSFASSTVYWPRVICAVVSTRSSLWRSCVYSCQLCISKHYEVNVFETKKFLVTRETMASLCSTCWRWEVTSFDFTNLFQTSGGLMDKYEVVRRLGDGSFGSVSLCRHKSNQSLVAIKRFVGTCSSSTNGRQKLNSL